LENPPANIKNFALVTSLDLDFEDHGHPCHGFTMLASERRLNVGPHQDSM
jgi:hypothetical protein